MHHFLVTNCIANDVYLVYDLLKIQCRRARHSAGSRDKVVEHRGGIVCRYSPLPLINLFGSSMERFDNNEDKADSPVSGCCE